MSDVHRLSARRRGVGAGIGVGPGRWWAGSTERRDAWIAVAVGVNLLVVAALAVGVPIVAVGGLALVAPAALAVVSRPQRGIVVLVAVLPYDGLLLIAPAPGVVSAWKEALVVLTFGAAMAARPGVRAAPGRRPPGWILPIAALAGLAVVSAVAVGGIQGVYGLKIMLFFTLAAAATWRCPLSPGERDIVVGSLMISGAVVATWGIAQQVIGPEALHAYGYDYNSTIRFAGGFLRSFSTFGDPFSYAYYLLVVLAIGLPVALADRHRPRNQAFLLLVPLVVVGLAMSVVRGSLLGVAVVFAYLGVAAARPQRILLVCFPLVLAAVLVVPGPIAEAALSSSSTVERTTGWSQRAPELARNPFGAGIGSAGAVAEKVVELTGSDEGTYQPDNQYVLYAYELGPLGAWLQVLLLAGVLGMARRTARRRNAAEGALADGLAALTAAAATVSLISTFFEIFPIDALWWVLTAVVSTIGAEGADPAPPSEFGAAVVEAAGRGSSDPA